jgi:hypothetical protein
MPGAINEKPVVHHCLPLRLSKRLLDHLSDGFGARETFATGPGFHR